MRPAATQGTPVSVPLTDRIQPATTEANDNTARATSRPHGSNARRNHKKSLTADEPSQVSSGTRVTVTKIPKPANKITPLVAGSSKLDATNERPLKFKKVSTSKGKAKASDNPLEDVVMKDAMSMDSFGDNLPIMDDGEELLDFE